MNRSKYDMVAKSQVEDDIEHICGIFDNLAVCRVKRKHRRNGRYKNTLKGELCGENIPVKDRSLHKAKKSEKKSILRESRLKLPANLVSVVKKQHLTEKRRAEIDKESCSLRNSSQVSGAINVTKTCSMEFRSSNLSSIAELSSICTHAQYCDNESDELADYFEEVLCLPKPMSAMAEMMYG